ncbi:hypothetical protein TWF569_007794 [Orbilia oligospora]|uniref:Potassium channel tetramerisation-type BTB domain-containing protein n=1 Tax=Orbilia oligospora TaxID=2813651 RepID=A0A7C8NCX1_ORBOL|nr:hypothetical protein TWF102_003382 [Orbilia oligospora]KAF3104665.1 hypothetical protein TWF706_004453 [Orbilia oligospora]KAF3104666.1 hypothetical protein TWF706_004453 [Orbilia oligospora]KAF3115362.1 hypothetical protein TWF103_010793 [Orbilia oligospora]KAF3139689.1 hypothetical protein TWF594_006553 [Orbilia oligospora]
MSFNGGSSDQSSPHASGFGLTPSYSALTPGQFGFESLNDNLMNAASNEPEGVVNEFQFNTIPFEDDSKADISKLELKQSSSQQSNNIPRSGSGSGSRPAGDLSLHGMNRIPHILPHDKVFNIQVGCQMFSLSGASISSDAPSYFSSYFGKQLQDARGQNEPIRALHIDRDPEIFRDIVRHLQGYYVPIRSPEHFAYLFADAQLFQLPKLISRLFESEIFMAIGSRSFQIPRDLFSAPGDSPNYFTLGFAVFFSSPDEVFPGLKREGLLRPPSITPPEVPNRSGDVFSELLHLLRGYPVEIRNDTHRAALLRDCRYYHLRGLEQKLIAHTISYNSTREREEITIRIEDIKPSGLNFALDSSDKMLGFVTYARPFNDDTGRELVLEIGNEHVIVSSMSMSATFREDTKKRVAAIAKLIFGKISSASTASTRRAIPALLGQPYTPAADLAMRVIVDEDTDVLLDGRAWGCPLPENTHLEFENPMQGPLARPLKRRRMSLEAAGTADTWTVKKGLWKLQILEFPDNKVELMLKAIKLDAISGETGRNMTRSFLPSSG